MGEKIKISIIVGARPNFVKAAPLYSALRGNNNVELIFLHTGQHFDYEMSQAFFEDLLLPKPDYFLGVGGGSHSEQTGKIMVGLEKIFLKENPDLNIVFGDVNSTLAASIASKKINIPLAHVEAGLRSFDMTMPEEVNRKITDVVADLLFTPSEDAGRNLKKEGVDMGKVFFVGNIMIDSLVKVLTSMSDEYESKMLRSIGYQNKEYAVVTLHRPCNVDCRERLKQIVHVLEDVSKKIPVLFSVHPRTKKMLNACGLEFSSQIMLLKPLRYKEFIALIKRARFVLTDSGGIQEETTYLKIPCLTLRPNTERPITIIEGSNELVDINTIPGKVNHILSGGWKSGRVPDLWDGKTAERVANAIMQYCSMCIKKDREKITEK